MEEDSSGPKQCGIVKRTNAHCFGNFYKYGAKRISSFPKFSRAEQRRRRSWILQSIGEAVSSSVSDEISVA